MFEMWKVYILFMQVSLNVLTTMQNEQKYTNVTQQPAGKYA